ncbi:MAG: serine/threonine protein kinase [Lachnospiraceae bacterium]|nr:serine/threonine protein kinase [Lachnospiraceae bacterium]
MLTDNQYPLTVYEEISPLCEKGHVLLVQNRQNGLLYVKKQISCGNRDIYLRLKKEALPHIPIIFGVYGPECGTSAKEDTEKVTPPSPNSLTIIEEYIPGSTLAELLQSGKQFSEKEVINITLQLCRILMELHSMKPPIIHRDIKPSNVMLSSDGTVTLLDFNAAKAENPYQNKDTVLLGTAGFAAPEQYGFQASSHQTDIYNLGALMNLLLTRRLPADHLASGKLRRIIRLCLQVDPKHRCQDVWELYYALKRVRRIRIEWLPPGFRALKPYYMIPAIIGYPFLFLFVFQAALKHYDTVYDIFQFHLIVLCPILLSIYFYADYMGIRRYFPFMRSSRRWLRTIGFLLAPLTTLCVLITGLILLEIILQL